MKKTALAFTALALIVLLGLAVHATSFVLGSGRMGPGMSGASMMHGTGAVIENEYQFLVHMIPHHEEAVLTAKVLKENTEREEMRRFAEAIISTQSDQIGQMTAWLAAWYPERDHDIDYQPMMRDLKGLKGTELDMTFLQDMIPHHMVAIMMSQQLISRGLAEHEEVTFLARDVRNEQRDEIHVMSNWISKWYGNAPTAATGYGITMLLVGLIALVALVVLVARLTSVVSYGSTSKVSSAKAAKELLDVRYARGEISQEEYRSTRRNLEG